MTSRCQGAPLHRVSSGESYPDRMLQYLSVYRPKRGRTREILVSCNFQLLKRNIIETVAIIKPFLSFLYNYKLTICRDLLVEY